FRVVHGRSVPAEAARSFGYSPEAFRVLATPFALAMAHRKVRKLSGAKLPLRAYVSRPARLVSVSEILSNIGQGWQSMGSENSILLAAAAPRLTAPPDRRTIKSDHLQGWPEGDQTAVPARTPFAGFFF